MAKRREITKKGMVSGISLNREALISIIKLSNLLMKSSGKFFSKFVITDVQFNILMILKGQTKGMNQQALSKELLVTKSNVVGLIDRMEKTGLVERREHPTDRRCHTIALTKLGLEMLARVEISYLEEVDRIMSLLDTASKKNLITVKRKLEPFLSQRGES